MVWWDYLTGGSGGDASKDAPKLQDGVIEQAKYTTQPDAPPVSFRIFVCVYMCVCVCLYSFVCLCVCAPQFFGFNIYSHNTHDHNNTTTAYAY